MPASDDETLRELLSMTRIAVVGCSSTSGKAAHEIPAYLQRHGYEIYPVNPFADDVLGQPAVDSLADVEEDIELVNVFRPTEEVPGIVEEILDRKAAAGDIEALWLQLGIHDDEAVQAAEDAVLQVVSDRCMKVEHQRLST